ncbi:hypothetical protein J2809_002797 [Arthrobacter pascens]|nr:hypothetical protein [Arthrobacter pascens]MDR6558427.1 hypothetical protein [Arthrobacter pascens]
MAEELPTFDDMRSNAFAMLGDVEEKSAPTRVRAPDRTTNRLKH